MSSQLDTKLYLCCIGCRVPIKAHLALLQLVFFNSPRLRDLRAGTLVGTDQFGNKYFENKDHIYSKFIPLLRSSHESHVPVRDNIGRHYKSLCE